MKLYQATVTVDLEAKLDDAKLDAALEIVRSEMAYAMKTVEHRLALRFAMTLKMPVYLPSQGGTRSQGADVKVTATE